MSLETVGKPASGPPASVNSVGPGSSLLQVTDKRTALTYLVDTGAEVSILPVSSPIPGPSSADSTTPTLRAANGSVIKTYGRTQQQLTLGNHAFTASLLRADVERPILGADFLHTHQLLVDLAGRRLLLPGLLSSIPCSKSSCSSLFLTLVSGFDNPYNSLLRDFPSLTAPIFSSDGQAWCPPFHPHQRPTSLVMPPALDARKTGSS